MYNYQAKVLKPIMIKRMVLLDIGMEVSVQAEHKYSERVTIQLSNHAQVLVDSSSLSEIEGTAFVD